MQKNMKEYLLRAKIKRRGKTISNLERELEGLAEVYYNLPENSIDEKKKIIEKMKKIKKRVEYLTAERKALIQKVVNMPDL